MRKPKVQAYCSTCGWKCSGKMMIEARGTKDYIVCTTCFGRYRTASLKEVRDAIKKQ